MKTYKEFLNLAPAKYHPFFVGFDKKNINIKINEDTSAPSIGKLHKILTDHYKKHIDNKNRKHVYQLYTNSSSELNKHLLAYHVHGDNNKKQYEEHYVNNRTQPWKDDVDRLQGNGDPRLNDAIKKAKSELIRVRDTARHEYKTHFIGVVLKNADSINNHMKSAPALKHDLHVYSGVGFSPERYHDGVSDKIHVHLPAFTSTSIDKDVAKGFAKRDTNGIDPKHRHIIKIHIPEGSKGVFLGYNSSWEDEKEFLLPRHSKLHIHPVPDITKNEGDYIKMWHAKLVHDGFNPTRFMDE